MFAISVLMRATVSLAFKDPRPRRSGQAVKESMDDFLLEDEEVLAQVTSIFYPTYPRFPQALHALMAAV